MLSKIFSASLIGLEAYLIEIEVDIYSRTLPQVNIVGLPDSAVRESKERVRSSLRNNEFEFPGGLLTINLAPADVKKEGPAFDLPIALGILAADGKINEAVLKDYCILGELALDGRIRAIKGALPIAHFLSRHKNAPKKLILPKENAQEAAVVKEIEVFAVNNLKETVYFLNNPDCIAPLKIDVEKLFQQDSKFDIDFSDVKGQFQVKRGLEIAASGGHNVLMIGPPGSGKTMLAKRLPTILPNMTIQEAVETTKIHSVIGLVKNQALITKRPFRSPHHTASDIALVGGGQIPQPGEISLSHNGVLFLDELPEFHRDVLEVLRQPLEDGSVTIARAHKSLTFPSRFMLVSAMNPCPCGFFTDPKKECRCTPNKIQQYLSKISGPLLDRIDLHIEVASLNYQQLSSNVNAETSEQIKERVNSARAVQTERFKNEKIFANSQMNHKQIKFFCALDQECKDLLKMAIDELGFSARAHDKILKISRTIADLESSDLIKAEHISEAISYRSLDRNLWV
jgi:magnesium chelatase family protein